ELDGRNCQPSQGRHVPVRVYPLPGRLVDYSGGQDPFWTRSASSQENDLPSGRNRGRGAGPPQVRTAVHGPASDDGREHSPDVSASLERIHRLAPESRNQPGGIQENRRGAPSAKTAVLQDVTEFDGMRRAPRPVYEDCLT